MIFWSGFWFVLAAAFTAYAAGFGSPRLSLKFLASCADRVDADPEGFGHLLLTAVSDRRGEPAAEKPRLSFVQFGHFAVALEVFAVDHQPQFVCGPAGRFVGRFVEVVPVPVGHEGLLVLFEHDIRSVRTVVQKYQIIDLITNGVDGIHLYTMNRPEIAKEILMRTNNIFAEFKND